MSKPEPILVFVYGTLKRGGRNHYLLGNSPMIAQAKTLVDYPLYISGLPYLLDVPGVGARVRGEVYLVSPRTIRYLDALEGHPRFYRRRITSVMPTRGDVVDKPIRVYAYFLSHQYLPASEQRSIAMSMKSYPNHYANAE